MSKNKKGKRWQQLRELQRPSEPVANVKPNIFIVGEDPLMRAMFLRKGYPVTESLPMAGIVVFTGGADINPALYNQHALALTRYSVDRDRRDIWHWDNAPTGCFKVGICRGGQLTNVLCGGALMQHVSMHTGPHEIVDKITGEVVTVSSTHHQQFVPSADAEVIAVGFDPKYDTDTPLATIKLAQDFKWERGKGGAPMPDYEVLYYAKERTLCFQPHPEYRAPAHPDTTEPYFFSVLERVMGK